MKPKISPTKATITVDLPPEFACVYSPGFKLHVSGFGDNKQQAYEALRSNLDELAAHLSRCAGLLEAP